MPCARASAQVILPFPLSSYNSGVHLPPCAGGGAAVGGGAAPGSVNCMAVLAQVASTCCAFEASAWFIERLYFHLTCTTWFTYQHLFIVRQPLRQVLGDLVVSVDAGAGQS